MNMDQIWGVVRTILTALVAYAAGKNWIPANIIPADLVASIMTLVVAVWSIMDKTQAATVKKAAAIVPIATATQREVGIDNPVPPSSASTNK